MEYDETIEPAINYVLFVLKLLVCLFFHLSIMLAEQSRMLFCEFGLCRKDVCVYGKHCQIVLFQIICVLLN